MRWLLTLALLALGSGPVAAQENEAEKLFRRLEQRVRTAKTLQLRFDATITGADAKKWNVAGSLILGEGDKLRVDSEGKVFGEEFKLTQVSDGTDMKSFGYTKAPGKLKQDKTKTEKPPTGAGAYLRESLPSDGFFLSFLSMDRRAELPPGLFKMSDFKLAGEEKIGEQNTRLIQYTLTAKGDTNVVSMKIWLDAKTNLPVKLAMTGGHLTSAASARPTVNSPSMPKWMPSCSSSSHWTSAART